MQGHERSKGMSKSKAGLQSLGQGSQERVWHGEGRAGSGTWSSETRTEVCGWMGYVVGDLRTSSGHGEVWIGVPVQCYTECNTSQEACANAATSIKVILVAEFGVPEAGAASSGGAKDSVSFRGWNEMLPNTQSINSVWEP